MRPDTAEHSAGSDGPTGEQKTTKGPRHQRRRGRRARVVLPVLAAVVLALVAARLALGTPMATARLPKSEQVVAGGKPVPLSWPPVGQAAVAVPKTGLVVASGPEHPVPVASLTKIMTAYLILRDHPLGRHRSGPELTMGPKDVGFDLEDVAQGESTLKVAVGEQLSERQLLEGMLLHSAGNFAESLATWDAGSEQAFVDKMNATARALSLRNTHYADASGLDDRSVSTPTDQLALTERALGEPAFAALVALRSATLPLVGPQFSYTPFLGTLGVVGVKTGYTSAAGGCVVLAVHEHLGATGAPAKGGRHALVLAAVTGQAGNDVLTLTGFEALVLAGEVASHTVVTKALRSGERLGSVSFDGVTAPVVASTTARLLALPGQALTVHLHGDLPAPGAARGTPVGVATVSVGAEQRRVPLRLARPLPGESLVQHLS